MSHNKPKLLFRVFHYLTLYVVLFNFIVYPAYAVVEHFPYGMSSRYAFPYIRPYEAGYETESDKRDEAKETASKNRQRNFNKSRTSVVSEHYTSMVIVEYSAAEKSGKIGNSSDGFDDPSDNIFTLKIDKKQLQGKELVLQYDVYGIENASGVSKSINEHTATGGTVIKRSEEWRTVQETVSAAQFKNGSNHLLFTGFDNTNYSIRNLKLRALSEKSTAGITLVDGTTLYMQNGSGYVKGVSLQNSAELYIEGKLVKTKDGVFETVVADADKLNQIDYVLLDKTGKTVSSGALPIHNKVEVTLLNNQKSAYGKTLISDLGNEEFAIDTENVSFNISKKSYEKADAISVQQLRAIDMAPLGTNVINVTASKSGYRFLPDGAKFNDNALVGIKYDTLYLPKGYTPADIKVLYFDMEKRRWLSIPTDTIVKDQSKIIANTTHFTDYIAGVIQAPESPETSSFTPTSISDIQVANPTANIVQIQPPTANQQGDGTVDFPITLPPGRAGLQPNLSVSYNNNGSSGIVGQGWDINVPVISVDTRFGVPTYDPEYETESYLLNGEEIMMKDGISFDNWVVQQSYYLPHRSGSQRPRGTDVEFFPKVESSFSKIIRKGDSPSNYYWEIWDKSGTKYTYGDSLFFGGTYAYQSESVQDAYSSILKSHPTDPEAKRAKWFLSEVRDKNNNVIKYSYRMKTPTSGTLKDGMEVYLSSIVYNLNTDFNASNPNDPGAYAVNDRNFAVSFLYRNATRGDAQTNYRYGFKENNSMLLDKINVSCIKFADIGEMYGVPSWFPNWRGRILPCDTDIEYDFTYNTQGPFAKTLLTKITTKNIRIDMTTGQPAETQQYEHQFQYHNDIAGGLFKSPEPIYVDKDFSGNRHSALSSSVEDFNSSYFGFSAGVSLPYDVPVWWPFSNSGTINLSFPSPTSESNSPNMLLMDIDGDGLDDKVMKIGNQVKYRKNLAGMQFSKQLYTAHHIGDLGFSQSNTKTDPELSFSLLFANLSSSKSQSNSRSRNYFADVNNDGLVDYVKDRIVYFNRMDPGSMMPSFTDNSNLTPNVIMRDGQVDPTVSQGLPAFTVGEGLMDVVKVWVAPKGGYVNITGNIIKPFVASHNGVRFSVEHAKHPSNISSYLINPTLLVNATLQTNVPNSVYVNKGDHIYFRVNTSQLPTGEVTVDWNPKVVYTDNTEGSSFSESFLFGNVEAEPLTIMNSGNYRVEWLPASLSLPSGIEIKVNVYKLDSSNLSAPKVIVQSYTQNVTNFLASPSSGTFYAGSNAGNPDTYLYVEIEAKGNKNLNWKQFDTAFEPKLRKLSDNSLVHIVPKYDMTPSVVDELGVGTLYKNWGQFAYKGALPTSNFIPINKEYISKAQLAGGVANYSSVTPSTTNIMNSQSGSVVYNFANGSFYSGPGGTPYTIPATQKAAIEHFMMLRPDRANLAWSAHPLLLVKAAAMNPNYRSNNSSFTPMKPIPAPTNLSTYGAYGIVKENTSVSQSSNWSASFYGFALGKGENRATSTPLNDFLDVNGDGYPDIVGDKIQFTSNKGGLTNNFLNKPLLAASLSSGSGFNAGGSTAHVVPLADRNGRFTRSKVGTSASFGGSKFETVTAANHVLLDINGDGLVDIVKPNGQVEFNTSADFVAGSWLNYDKPNVSKTESTSLSASIGADFSSFTNSLISQSNLDLSFGGSGSQSTTRREKDFVDINGDGLPDFISGNSVKINNGTAFSSTSYYLDRMSESTSFSIGTTLNGSILIPILIPIPVFSFILKVGGGGGTSFGKSYNEDNVSLRDFNGDGYPDIVETVSEYEIKVQYSKIGRTNMLKKIINPTGSTIELDYGTQNKIDKTTIGSTYKMPFKKWVLTSTKVNDGFTGDGENVQEYAFEYYNGFKDRRERKFLGFGEVKTHQLNSTGKVYRTVIQEYLLNDMPTQHVYLPGSHSDSRKYHYIGKLPKRTRTFDGMDRVLSEVYNAYNIYRRPYLIPINQTYNYNTTVPASNINYTDTSSIVPLLSNVNTTNYHYSVGGGGTSTEVVSRFKEYDTYGNVTKFDEEISGQVTNSVQIAYHYLNTGGKYNVATPVSHNLNNYQRYSTTTLDAKGNVNQINRYKDFGSSGSQVSTSDFVFDLFGNLTKVTLPAPNTGSSSAQRMFYNFQYDNFFHKNMIMISDAQGYYSQTTYNHFGLVTSQKDMNNVEIVNEYDPTLRLVKVKGPYNSQWTIKHEYKKNATTGRYYAITKHNIKDESVTPGEQILHTSSFADGLGRIIQTKKQLDLEQECGASTGYRFAVSGIQIYDEFGRVVEADLSQEQIDCNGNFASALENYTVLTRDQLLKTSMIYDMQDRVLQSHVHGLNASTIYEYGHDYDQNNAIRVSEKVTLPEGNVSQTLKDAKGQVVLTRQIDSSYSTTLPTAYTYNSIGELLSVTDADNKTTTYQYDTFGQKTQVTHPDNGISKFEYDLAGKLIASTNQNLLSQNSSSRVQYNYIFNQLQSVSYPDMMSNGVQIPASTVSYIYGGNGAPNYSAGRIISVNDLTGTKSFEYGKLGEVVKENRELQTAVGNLNFTTRYQYDTWGRMLNMTYPDGELVTYGYNPTGQLVSIFNDRGDLYLKNVTYNFFDQPVEIDYGNEVKTVNTYDLTQRVRSMRLDRPDTTTFMHNVYNYDKNQNIVKIVNGSSQHPLLLMGGVSNKSYTYDGFNRLAGASGQWSGGDKESHDYTLHMAYNNTHGIVNKRQHHNVQSPSFNGLSNNTYDAKYEYADAAHPHAVSTINYSNLSGSQTAVSNFAYDANGNLTNYNTTTPGSFANRDMVWDQQNRLLAVVDDNTNVSHYIYDYAGERTFKSVGAVTQVNIGGAMIHQVLDFNDYMVYPSGYVVVDPGKDEYSKHYYINGKRFVSRLERKVGKFINGPLGRQASVESVEDTTADSNAVEPLDLSSMMGVQNTIMGFTIGNTEPDCMLQVQNIVNAYNNLNNNTGGSIQNCYDEIKAIRDRIGTNGYTACDALVEINAYVCTPVTPGNTPGSTPTPSFTAEQLMQFDCLTELNILVGAYTAASDALDQQQSMMRGGNFKYGCNSPYVDHNCCIKYQQTGVWDCPDCPDLTPEDCAIVPVSEQTPDWQQCIKDCLHNGTNPSYGAHCWDHFMQTGEWMDDCFIWLVDCDQCSDLVGVTKPDEEEVNCLRRCNLPGMGQCLEYYDAYGVWTKECNDIGKECGCIRDESNEDEEILDCVQDCPNPRATECYDYYVENGVWMEGCEEVMTECGCYDFGTELDCYKQALNYIRKHLTFEPNNACAVLAYVQANFICSTKEIVRPETPYPFPDLNLPGVDDDGNNTLPDRDGPYDEDKRKPIWWYHTDHLGSSTYLTDNFGRPSHYYETLPFGEMMVEHNQSANVPSAVGYDNKFKFNGKELDDATQMYYYGARYYDPRISIFVSVDPLAEQTMTPYQYVTNNPIMFTDPTGMEQDGVDTKYKRSDGLVLLNTKDGSDDEIIVPDNKVADFREYNAGYQSGGKSTYDSQSWNENIKADILGFESVDKMDSYLGGYTTQWSRQNAIDYRQNPTIGNGFSASFSEALSQWTDPERLVMAGSIFVGGMSPARSSIKAEVNASKSVYVPVDEAGQSLKVTKSKAGNIKIDGEARGRAHTQLRMDATGNYPQRNTFDAKGRRRSDTHFTTHGEANKSNPHKHTYYRNGRRSGGR